MEKGFRAILAAVLLFLVTLAAAYVSYTTAALIYVPDYDPNILKFAIFSGIWLLAAWWTTRWLGAKRVFLAAAGVAMGAAVVAAVGAADCIYDACPLVWYLLATELFGFPAVILGLAAGFTSPRQLWIGLAVLSLPFVSASALPGRYLYLAIFLPLALVILWRSAIYRTMMPGSPTPTAISILLRTTGSSGRGRSDGCDIHLARVLVRS